MIILYGMGCHPLPVRFTNVVRAVDHLTHLENLRNINWKSTGNNLNKNQKSPMKGVRMPDSKHFASTFYLKTQTFSFLQTPITLGEIQKNVVEFIKRNQDRMA
jgi:hypothetical protein